MVSSTISAFSLSSLKNRCRPSSAAASSNSTVNGAGDSKYFAEHLQHFVARFFAQLFNRFGVVRR